jgi:uncharacterized protein
LTTYYSQIFLIIFLGALLQGFSGFGFALLSVPLLLLILDPTSAVCVITFGSIVASMIAIFKYYRFVQWRETIWMSILVVIFAPLGVYLLQIVSVHHIHLALGVILIYNSCASLFSRYLPTLHFLHHLPDTLQTFAIGAVSGILGGSLGMTGPLLANHLIDKKITIEAFKITLNIIFLCSAVWRIILYCTNDMITYEVGMLGLQTQPIAIVGILIGEKMTSFVNVKSFIKIVHLLLLCIGVWQVALGLL